MVILSMTATFGCLEKATLTLQGGLNLLERPNESGKSTWCAFIRAMFYGLESRKGGEFSERNRYTPWSGSAMRGEMDLIWQDKAITLRRFPKASNPFGGFQCVYTGTEEPVPGLTADNVGQSILGVTKEVFQRTCFIPQSGLRVDASGDLERRVASLATAGEEDVSYSDASQRLRAWRNQRQSNRAVGSLPKSKEQLADLADRRRRLSEAQARAAQAREQLDRLEIQQAEVEADLARHAKVEQIGRLADRREHYERARLRRSDAETALHRAKAAYLRAQSLVPAQPKRALPFWLPLVPALAGGVALVLCGVLLPAWPLLAAGALVMLAGGLASRLIRARQARFRALSAQAQDLLSDAQVRLDWAQREHDAAQTAWEALSAQGEPPLPPQVDDPPQNDLRDDQVRRTRLSDAAEQCRDQLSRALGEEEALGDLAGLEEQMAGLERDIAREEEELAALNLALEALDAANATLRARFSPALNAQAGAILSRLTGGRYDTLTFTREFEALAQTGAGARSARLLSQGTADQTYLALRLALCQLALPISEPPPLVLDDALVTFDDGRLALALDVLNDLAGQRQVLLFTCQSRERAALAISPGNDYNSGGISYKQEG